MGFEFGVYTVVAQQHEVESLGFGVLKASRCWQTDRTMSSSD